MKLSELMYFDRDIRLIDDGEFEILGLVNIFNDRKTLSFIENEQYIMEMSKNITCIF